MTQEVRTLAALVDRELGVQSHPQINPMIAATPGAVAAQFLRNNPGRVAFIFFNLSANDAYIMTDNAVAAARGMFVAPNGGHVSVVWKEDLNLVGFEWWVITPAGASAIFTLELVIQ